MMVPLFFGEGHGNTLVCDLPNDRRPALIGEQHHALTGPTTKLIDRLLDAGPMSRRVVVDYNGSAVAHSGVEEIQARLSGAE